MTTGSVSSNGSNVLPQPANRVESTPSVSELIEQQTQTPDKATPATPASPPTPKPAPRVTFSASGLAGTASTGDANITTTGVAADVTIPLGPRSTATVSTSLRNNNGSRENPITGESAPVSNTIVNLGATVRVPLTGPADPTKVSAYASAGVEFSNNTITKLQTGQTNLRVGATASRNLTGTPGELNATADASVGVSIVNAPGGPPRQETVRPQGTIGLTYKPEGNSPVSIGVQGVVQGRMPLNAATDAALDVNGGRLVAGARAELGYQATPNLRLTVNAAHTFAGTLSSNDPFGGPGGISPEKGATTFGISLRGAL
jgi:hypothetical protein